MSPGWQVNSSPLSYLGSPKSNVVKNKIPWRRKWQPTLAFLSGKSHGQRSPAGYSPWGQKESDMTERHHFHFPNLLIPSKHCITDPLLFLHYMYSFDHIYLWFHLILVFTGDSPWSILSSKLSLSHFTSAETQLIIFSFRPAPLPTFPALVNDKSHHSSQNLCR